MRRAKGKHHRAKGDREGKGERQRDRERRRSAAEWESRESFRHRAAASCLRNGIRNRCGPFPCYCPFPSHPSRSVLSLAQRSLLATGLSATRPEPRAPSPPSLRSSCHTLLQRLCLFDLFLAALFFFSFSFCLLPFAIDVPVSVFSAFAFSSSRSGNFFSAVVCILIMPKAARTVTGSTGNTFAYHLCIIVCTFGFAKAAIPKPQYDNG